MFSSIGHPGPFGLPPILLAISLLFLLIAFPSAGVVGQEGGDDPCQGQDPCPRHLLFKKTVEGNDKYKTENAFNYVCEKFGKTLGDDANADREFCGCVVSKI
jgi:hypothetical protein